MVSHGQVWWADLDGSKIRPVVVLTHGHVAPLLYRILVAPVTTTIRELPTEVLLGDDEGLASTSAANLDNVALIEPRRLVSQLGEVSDERWPEFCRAMAAVLGC